MILQKSFQYADFGAQETFIIMINLKMVVLLTIFYGNGDRFSVFFDEHSIFIGNINLLSILIKLMHPC